MKFHRTLLALVFIAVASNALLAQNDPNKKDWIQLFNGKDLSGWDIKISGYALNDNFGRTFRVENGLIKTSFDQYGSKFGNRFGHMFHHQKFSHYIIALEYRFVGEQAPEAPSWALRNSGVMVHSQSAQSMLKDQDFPICIEVQLLGGTGSGKRTTANLCTPGTNVEMNSQLFTTHCINSTSKTYDGDQWVTVEIVVHADSIIHHIIEGDTVISYSRPRVGPEMRPEDYPVPDGTLLREGHIALQAESDNVEFRKVELLDLSGK